MRVHYLGRTQPLGAPRGVLLRSQMFYRVRSREGACVKTRPYVQLLCYSGVCNASHCFKLELYNVLVLLEGNFIVILIINGLVYNAT